MTRSLSSYEPLIIHYFFSRVFRIVSCYSYVLGVSPNSSSSYLFSIHGCGLRREAFVSRQPNRLRTPSKHLFRVQTAFFTFWFVVVNRLESTDRQISLQLCSSRSAQYILFSPGRLFYRRQPFQCARVVFVVCSSCVHSRAVVLVHTANSRVRRRACVIVTLNRTKISKNFVFESSSLYGHCVLWEARVLEDLRKKKKNRKSPAADMKFNFHTIFRIRYCFYYLSSY